MQSPSRCGGGGGEAFEAELPVDYFYVLTSSRGGEVWAWGPDANQSMEYQD